MTERAASGVDDRFGGWIQGAKAIRKTRQDGGSNGTTWGDITMKAKKCKIEALKEAYEELSRKCGWRREYHFAVIRRVDDNAPSGIVILCREAGESIGERRDRATKRKWRETQEKFLFEQCKSGASR